MVAYRFPLSITLIVVSVVVGSAFVFPIGVRQQFKPSLLPLSAKKKKDKSGGGRGMGMGMGMGSTSLKEKKKKSSVKSAPFDAARALLRSEKLYEELSAEGEKLLHSEYEEFQIFSEYVVAAKYGSGGPEFSSPTVASGGPESLSDWVPVAQVCLMRPKGYAESTEHVKAAVSYHRREISCAATMGAPVFKSVPRNNIQYSIETAESFYKHVYDVVIEESNNDSKNDLVMTKDEARAILELEPSCNDLGEIKKAYRKKSFQLHPDRFATVERSKEEVNASNHEFRQAKLAYDTLKSGIRSAAGRSWYESLGGTERTDFVGPVDLLSIDKAGQMLDGVVKTAIVGLEPEIVQTFVTRNQLGFLQSAKF